MAALWPNKTTFPCWGRFKFLGLKREADKYGKQ